MNHNLMSPKTNLRKPYRKNKMRTGFDYVLENLMTAAIVVCLAMCIGCSTGIESTKKIKMSKEDVKLMTKTQEQTFAESIVGIPLSSWEKGRKFMAMSDRTLYIFDPSGMDPNLSGQSLKGSILTYAGLDSQTNPDLMEECVILFTDGTRKLRYKTGKPTNIAMREIESSKLPLLSDLSLIEEWNEKIKGKTLWTRSNLWYDDNGNRVPGLRFEKVSVADVLPSTGDFPIKIGITGPKGEKAYMQMNYTSDIHDSRNFADLFFLKDPKEKYPHISKENWILIQRGRLGKGMTKEECKLALGNPDEVKSGHSHSETMDIWQYSDGTYLFFADGLLKEFRQ